MPRVRDPGELLAQVASGDFDADVRAWLIAGAQAYLRADMELPLDRCLQIPRGQRARVARRNYWLRRAYTLCSSPPGYQRAEELSVELARFRTQIAPGLKLRGGLREDQLSELRAALLKAFRQGCRIPDSARQLWRIVTDITSADLSVEADYAELVQTSAPELTEVNDA